MAQYIEKSALVAEIDNWKQHTLKCGYAGQGEYEEGNKQGRLNTCEKILSFLETLEVKDVDLEKEINEWQGREAFPEGVSITPLPKAMEIVERTAKHFFELGLFSQLTWQDIRLIAEIGEDFMNSEESDNLSDEEYYTAILNKLKNEGRDCKTSRQWIRDISKAQKGE